MDFVRNRLGKFTDLAYRLKVSGDGGMVMAGVGVLRLGGRGFDNCCCVFSVGKVNEIKKDSGWKWGGSLFEGSCDSMMIISDFRLLFFSVYTRMSQ